MDEPVQIVMYDPTWPERFETEKRLLSVALAKWLVGPIEHVGSTAVPGLAAKPVIDMMAGVSTLDDSRSAIGAVEALQYCYSDYAGDVMHWFCKPSPMHRTHHLHLVPFRSQLWTERLLFRDYLRSHPQAVSEYATLKARLAEEHRFDRERYTDAKGPFIQRILSIASAAADEQ